MNDISAKALVYALLAVAAGALVLALSLPGYQWLASRGDTSALFLPSKDFRVVVGQAQVDGERQVVTGLAGEGPRRQAVLSHPQQLDADTYRYVTVDSSRFFPGVDAALFWRKLDAGQGDGLFSQALPGNVAGRITLDMSLNPAWGGQLSELGVVLVGDTDALPVALAGINLQGPAGDSAARSLLTQWTGFRRFDQATVNRLPATFSPGAISPVPLAALCAAIALLLLALGRAAGKAVPRHAGLLAVLFIWLALDLLWQRQLSAQLALSQYLFQGRSMAERHARDIDGGLFEYAAQLKQRGLPASPARLFILHNSRGHNYQRLKLQYYLLPHNIYNLDSLPPEGAVREGDYILALQPLPGMEYHAGRSLLRWGGGAPVPATLEHSHPLGKLFRIGEDSRVPAAPAVGEHAP